MAPGARSKFGARMFEPEVFRKQMYCIKKVLVTLLGLFGPHVMPPCPPVVSPVIRVNFLASFFFNKHNFKQLYELQRVSFRNSVVIIFFPKKKFVNCHFIVTQICEARAVYSLRFEALIQSRTFLELAFEQQLQFDF